METKESFGYSKGSLWAKWSYSLLLLFVSLFSLGAVALEGSGSAIAIDTLLVARGDSVSRVEETTDSLAHLNTSPIDTLPSAFRGLPKKAMEWINNLPSSKRALICASVPGGGQIYNKMYWKAPLVWGLGLGCAYAINQAGSLYNEYRTAYREFMSENPLQYDTWKSFVPSGGNPKDYVGNDNIRSRLKQGTTLYRRNRDFAIILSCLAYLLTLLDVYVDAEMVDYDISPNLSMWIPESNFGTSSSYGNIPTIGVQCSIPF